MSQMTLPLTGTVESVVKTKRNGPLIFAAATLWIDPDDRVLDVTYGRGLFWTDYLPDHLTTHDKAIDGVDFRHLPHDDQTFDVVVFDPPYIAPGGRDTSSIPGFLDRYGLADAPKTTRELELLIWDGMVEARRVLTPKGRLFVKCMDYITGGAYQQGRHTVVSYALELGLEQVDEFIHYSGIGPQPKRARQLHSRRAHSFLCIFQKP